MTTEPLDRRHSTGRDRRQGPERRADHKPRHHHRRRISRLTLAPIIAAFACIGVIATSTAVLRSDVTHLRTQVHALEQRAGLDMPSLHDTLARAR